MTKPGMKKEPPDPQSREALQAFDNLFGLHPGFRPVHAKGILLSGTFAPSSSAKALTKAPHANRPSTRVEVRFSDFAGIPAIPDYDENASPRGFALRFYLAEHVHTDIIGHSIDAFPTRTVEDSFAPPVRAAPARRNRLRSSHFLLRIRPPWHSCRRRSPYPAVSRGNRITR